MATGTFTISMGSYYSKSKELKRKTEATIDDVQHDFIQRVHSHLSDVASEDRSFLEQSDAYTSAKRLKQQIEQKHLKKANEMSTDSARNPLHPLIECDDKYASKLKAIADNKNEADVNKAIQKMKTAIETEKVSIEGSTMLKKMEKFLSKDDFKRLSMLFKTDPTAALNSLLNNKKFIDTISKDEKVADFFVNFMIKLENGKNIPINLMEKLFDNNKFYNMLLKANPKTQGKVLDFMMFIQQKGTSIGGKMAEYFSYVEKFSGGFVKGFSQFGATKLGKAVTNPYAGIVVEAGFSAVSGYFDKDEETYKNIGKSVVGGVVDGIASVGPIDGALIGASIGGPPGAIAGLVIGGASQLGQFIFPGAVDGIKDGCYKLYDKVSEWGQGVKQGVQSMAKKATNVGKAVTQKIANSGVAKKATQLVSNVKDTFDSIKIPSLSWF